MKKNMIALAVAGALVAPVAMAEVSVSGGLQAELVQVGGDGVITAKGLYAMDGMEAASGAAADKGGNSGNYGFLKFAASDDLGGGMKALATYNMNIAVDNVLATREAFIGLNGGFGTVLAGRLATPYKSSTVSWDPFLATSFQARGNYGMSVLHNGYANNALAYANSFAGGMVNLVAAVVLDETRKSDPAPATNDSTVGKTAKSFSVNVKPMAGLEAAVAWISASKFGNVYQTGVFPAPTATSVAAAPDKATATKVGVKYSAGAVTVAGQVEMLDKGLTGSGKKGNIMYLTATFKMDDVNSISAGFGNVAKNANDGVDAATYGAVGMNHAFSKNTSGMIGYRISNDKAGGGNKETAIGAGLRVNF